MKLRNKYDGRVREFGIDETKSSPYYLRDELGNTYWAKTLKEIADKWEEMEEPKEYWAIDCFVPDGDLVSQFSNCSESVIENRKSIGNYFETKEETERAREKLKAYRRLKDKGFRFRWIDMQTGQIKYSFYLKDGQKITRKDEDDLLLLFGGEE